MVIVGKLNLNGHSIQGSIIASLDSGTGTLTKIGYQAYGEHPGLTSGSYRYTAQRFDPETAGSSAEPSGLYDYRARIYSPTLGRFLQPDPAGYVAGTNLYAYVGDDPLNFVDPTGLAADSVSNYLSESASSLGQISSGITNLINNPSEIPSAITSVAAGISPVAAELPEALSTLAGAINGLSSLFGQTSAAPESTVTVGRVMSPDELSAMQSTGKVQESFNLGVTGVTLPPNPDLYLAGPSSDVFVQFDVPQSAINAAGGGTARIYGPNSMFGPSLGITEMPPATNIVVPNP